MKSFFYIICLLVFNIGNAQLSGSGYSVKWLGTKEGLSQLSVRFCIQDKDGFLWIATELGLYRYDGNRVSSPHNNNYRSINSKRIFCLVKDYNSNIIYFSTHPDLKFYSISNGIVKEVKDIYKVGFFQSHSSFFNTDRPNYHRIREIIKKNYFFNPLVNFLNCGSVATKDCFYYFDPIYISCIDSKGVETKITRIKANYYSFLRFGNTVVGLGANEINLFEKNQIKDTSISCDEIITSYIKSNNDNFPYERIFFSNDRYFLNFNGNIHEIKYRDQRLYTEFLFKSPANDIRSLSYSKNEDSFYLCSSTKGLAIVKPQKINVFVTGNEILDCNYAVVENDNTWYSYNGWQYNRYTNKCIIKKNKGYLGNMRFLLSFKNNNYLQVEKYKFRSIQDGVSFAPLKINEKFDYLTSYTYLKNKLWICSMKNIGYFSGDSIVIDKTIDKVIRKGSEINTIATFKDDLIIGTTKGVYKYNPATKITAPIQRIENVYARYIKQIDDSSFWVGCYGDGLFLVKNNKAFKVVDKNIELNTAHAIEEDKKGNLWISTNNGLLTIDKETIIKNTLHKLPVACYRYTIEDGLLTNEFNGGGTHPSLKTYDDIIGFPSMKGFVWFDPQKTIKHRFSGRIMIDEIVIDNSKSAVFRDNQYTINKDGKVVTINFSYGYYCNRDNLTISYRFEDQKKWTEITGNSFQIGRYKAGNNRLLLRIDTHGFKEEQGIVKSINLNFEPRYFETFWFWSLITILMISFIYISYLLGRRLKNKNAKLLKNKVDEKTAMLKEMVSELETSRNSVAKSLHEKDILLKEVHHRVKNNLQLIISMLNIQARRDNYSNIYDFLKKGETRISSMALIHKRLYQSEDSLDKINFELFLNDLVTSIIKTFEISNNRIQVDINIKEIVLNLTTAIPLGLIVNELITNSLKHAFPNNKEGNLSITILNQGENKYVLIVEDNGIGISKTKKESKSFGLELISLLASQLEGNVKFEGDISSKYTIQFTEIEM